MTTQTTSWVRDALGPKWLSPAECAAVSECSRIFRDALTCGQIESAIEHGEELVTFLERARSRLAEVRAVKRAQRQGARP